jgi:HSP20 family molecular chaperone IbpA
MSTDPYEDIFRNLTKAMEEFINTISEDETPRFVSCTIISGGGEDPRIFRFDESGDDDIDYEAIEGPENIYITAEMPSTAKGTPFADIQPNFVRICVDDQEVKVDLPCAIDVQKSTYTVRHGVMDIICQKLLVLKKEP